MIAGEDVTELRRTVTQRDLLGHADLFQFASLEGADILRGGGRLGVEFEIDQRRGGELDGGETLVEFSRGQEPLQQIVRQRLAGLVVAGELLQHLGPLLPVLVELRRQLDEIGEHGGARQRRIGHVGEHAVQAVAELVEQGAGIVGRQQRGLGSGALGEIADIDDERRDLAVELLLVAQRGHPGAGALGRPGEVVAVEQRLVLAVTAPDLPDPDVGMPERDILALGEGDAEQAGGAVEGGLDHVVEHQIGLDRSVVEIGAALPQLFGVVTPIPRGEREVAALLRDQRLHRVAVGKYPGACGLPDPLQEAANGLRRLGHGIFQPVGGVGRVAHDLRALLAQSEDLDHGGVIVVAVAIVAAGREGLEGFLAQVASA